MSRRTERLTKVTSPTERTVEQHEIYQEEPNMVAAQPTPTSDTLATRIIWYVAGVLLVLLAFRFVFALLGANTTNGFANFIFSSSHPFVAPFFSLFGYNMHYGVSRFETFTLVAMAVYAVIAWGLARLVTLNRPRPE